MPKQTFASFEHYLHLTRQNKGTEDMLFYVTYSEWHISLSVFPIWRISIYLISVELFLKKGSRHIRPSSLVSSGSRQLLDQCGYWSQISPVSGDWADTGSASAATRMPDVTRGPTQDPRPINPRAVGAHARGPRPLWPSVTWGRRSLRALHMHYAALTQTVSNVTNRGHSS